MFLNPSQAPNVLHLSSTFLYALILFPLIFGLSACNDGLESAEETDALGYRTEYRVDSETGVKQGVLRQYGPAGNLISEENYVDGQLDGERILYHENGQPDIIEHYVMGDFEGEYLTYDSLGTLSSRGQYTDGAMNKAWFFYYPNGEIRRSVNFEDNEENGPFRDWYANGQPKASGTLIEGDYEHGILHKYDESGQLERVMNCDRARCKTSWTRDSTHTPPPGVDMTKPG